MMPLERWLAHELAPDIAAALGPHGLQRRGLAPPGRDRAPARRAPVRPQEPRDAAVGAADPRALVRALRAGFRAVTGAPEARGARLPGGARSAAAAVDRPHRELLRLGRPGNPHPDRGEGHAGPRPPDHADRAARGADRRRRREGWASPSCRCRSGRSGCRACSRCAAGSRRTAGDVDVVNTHSSTDSWLAALACATLRHAPPIVRTRHVSTTVHNRIGTTLAVRPRDRARRHHRRGAAPPARARQRHPARPHDVGADRHRPRALRARRRGGGARAARAAGAARARHRRHAARLEGPRVPVRRDRAGPRRRGATGR